MLAVSPPIHGRTALTPNPSTSKTAWPAGPAAGFPFTSTVEACRSTSSALNDCLTVVFDPVTAGGAAASVPAKANGMQQHHAHRANRRDLVMAMSLYLSEKGNCLML